MNSPIPVQTITITVAGIANTMNNAVRQNESIFNPSLERIFIKSLPRKLTPSGGERNWQSSLIINIGSFKKNFLLNKKSVNKHGKQNKTMLSYPVNLKFEDSSMEEYWRNLLIVTTDMWNFCSKRIFEQNAWTIPKAHNLCYYPLKKEFPEIPAQLCIKVEQDVVGAYKAYRKRNNKNPKKFFVKKAYCVRIDTRLYSHLTATSIRLSSGKQNSRKEVKFVDIYPKFKELTEKYRMCDPLVHLSKGQFRLIVPFDNPEVPIQEETYLGIDLGMKRIATTSEGIAYTDKEYLKNRRRIRYNKRIFQKNKKHSHSARRKVRRLKHKEENISKNFCHTLANELLKTSKTVLVLEDLTKIKEKTSKTKNGFKRTRHNNALSQVPFYRIKEYLSYKALIRGKRIATVSPSYTSQMDCRNSRKTGCKRQGCRFYAKDGVVFDADWNAAINIRNRLHHSNSFNLPIDGRLNLIDRLSKRANRMSHVTCKPNGL